jgi:NAD(P)-dependent dehydrogenase (short-subunit alcohol dehydrogenase family)
MTTQPELLGQTVVVIGGSRGIGLETARQARAAGAEVIVTGRDPERLRAAAEELGAEGAAFDATDPELLGEFLAGLPEVDHIMVTAGGPYYAPLREMDFAAARKMVDEHLWLPLQIARDAHVRPGGSLIFISGTGARQPAIGLSVMSPSAVGAPALVKSLALEIAPTRVNLIAPGFVDTPLSAELVGDDIEKRRQELRDTLPIGRVVEAGDVAALALHLMTNTALTGATFDIDGGQSLIGR